MAGLAKGSGLSVVRRKQLLILLALCVSVAAIAGAAAVIGGPKQEQAPVRPMDTTRKTFGAPGESINPSELWRIQEGAKVSQFQTELTELKNRMEARDKAEAAAKQEAEEKAKRAEQEKERSVREAAEAERRVAIPKGPPPPSALPTAMAAGDLGVPPSGPMAAAMPSPPPQERIKGILRVDMGSATSGAPANKANAAVAAAPVPEGDTAGPNVNGQSAGTYLPAGSFMRGVLLAGLDAPTGGQSQQNPHPVLIEVLDMASLPNKFRADYKNCRIVANGVGDLSSERAYIRLDRMSCITVDGGAIDVAVKGYVADQSGKNGIRGRLVSKQGSVLANALVAGVASGIGQAFTQSAMTTSTSPLGSTQTVNNGKEMQAGLGQGVGKALDQLSRYYIQLAEKMFPIIEVDAGQPVDIVLTKGLSISGK